MRRAVGQVPVEAALAHVQLRADEEPRLRELPLGERLPGGAPGQVRGLLAPEDGRLLERLAVHRRIRVVRGDPRPVREGGAGVKATVFLQPRLDAIGHERTSGSAPRRLPRIASPQVRASREGGRPSSPVSAPLTARSRRDPRQGSHMREITRVPGPSWPRGRLGRPTTRARSRGVPLPQKGVRRSRRLRTSPDLPGERLAAGVGSRKIN